jgi:hypothetical protein
MFQRQNGRCAICGERNMRYHDPTFDHEHGRGAGGAKRDDRIWTSEGMPMNACVCYWCNSKKGSQQIPYDYQTKMTKAEFDAAIAAQVRF